jgi:hypothetical protein
VFDVAQWSSTKEEWRERWSLVRMNKGGRRGRRTSRRKDASRRSRACIGPHTETPSDLQLFTSSKSSNSSSLRHIRPECWSSTPWRTRLHGRLVILYFTHSAAVPASSYHPLACSTTCCCPIYMNRATCNEAASIYRVFTQEATHTDASWLNSSVRLLHKCRQCVG